MIRSVRHNLCRAIAIGFIAAAGTSPLEAADAEFRAGDIHIEQPWARATIGKGRVGVAYLRLRNSGDESDRLIGATTPAAEHASLHTHRMTGDILRMRPVDAIPIPAGGTAMLKPGGLHIMLMRMTRSLKQGEIFPLTLTFERAGTITVEVTVKSATAKSAEEKHHHGG
ncbi:MAG: copper chaperone PCu(A)C [Alphaproteobacteria bacterium]|nr:copper chaperone PCu(A)C [Alphaproteobacteria bacterium]